MKKLEVLLVQLDNVLLVKTLHIDEGLRGMGVLGSWGNYEVASVGSTQFSGKYLYVSGTARGNDGKVDCYKYSSISDATEARQAFERIIRRVNDGVA